MNKEGIYKPSKADGDAMGSIEKDGAKLILQKQLNW